MQQVVELFAPVQVPRLLPLRALPASVCYSVLTHWEERVSGKVTRTSISRQLTVNCRPADEHLLVTLDATPPVPRKPDPTALEEIVQRLAELYRRLVLRVTDQGQVVELLNQADIAQTWAVLHADLTTRYDTQQPPLATLLGAVTRQVQDPARLLASLRHDYLYAFLLQRPGQPTGDYPHLLGGAGVRLTQQFAPGPPPAAGRWEWQARGQLDEACTDRAVLARSVAAALASATGTAPPVVDPAALAVAYRASYAVDTATGWPLAVAATLTGRHPVGYSTEYDLTLHQLDA